MAETTIDRRVAGTRAALHDALLKLVVEKAYEAITVEDICRRADVGRSSFYAHYTGKDDLMRARLGQFGKGASQLRAGLRDVAILIR